MKTKWTVGPAHAQGMRGAGEQASSVTVAERARTSQPSPSGATQLVEILSSINRSKTKTKGLTDH